MKALRQKQNNRLDLEGSQVGLETSSQTQESPVTSQSKLNAVESALAKTAVVIPVRNEEDSLPHVLRDLPSVGLIVVADNGSSDLSAQLASRAGCEVAHVAQPGYGRACLGGMARIEKLIEEADTSVDFIAFVDGDYSDHVHLLPELLAPIVRNHADFVLGSRMLGDREKGAMHLQAIWGNRLACFLMNRIWKTSYTDLGPFRVIRRSSLNQLGMRDETFGWTIEMQIRAARAGLRALEIPVPYRRRIGVSKISGTVTGTVRAGYKILWTIAKYGLAKN